MSAGQHSRKSGPVVPSGRRARALVPVLIYIGLLISVVSSLGSPLVPTIAQDYGVSLGTAQWSLTVTLLVGAVASPVVGRLGDGPHRLEVLLTALCSVVLGSVLAALPGVPFVFLLVGRGLQGVGLALLPLVMSVARDHLSPERSRSALAALSVTAVVGVGLGYPLTGLIAEYLSFHAGFWFAALLGVLAMVLAVAVVPVSTHRPARDFDLPGALLLGAGLGLLLLGISEGEEWGWSSARLVVAVLLAVVLIGSFVRHELRHASPLVDLRSMRRSTVLTANITGVLAGVGMYMLMSMIIRYVQTPASTGYGLGTSIVVAGLVLLPMSVASFCTTRLVTHLSRWISAERLLPLGVLMFVVALAVFATSRSHLWEAFVVMGLVGLSIGASFAVMPRMIMTATPLGQTSSALALNQVLRTVGYSLGSALSATVLTAHTARGAVFPSNSGYTTAAVIAMVLLLGTAVLSWVLPRRQRAVAPVAGADLLVEQNAEAAISSTLTLEDRTDDEPASDDPARVPQPASSGRAR